MKLELRINGVTSEQEVSPQESLHTLLRREGYCSVKHACGSGECGACTVLVDDLPRPSCVMLAAQAGGCALTTVEGLTNGPTLHPLQAAFVEAGAAPCGFCTPGMLLSAYALLQSNISPSEAEVRDALSGNVCRCSGYSKPVLAVMRAAAVMRGETLAPLSFSSAEVQDEEQPTAVTDNAQDLVTNAATSTSERAGVTTRIPVITASQLAEAVVKTPLPVSPTLSRQPLHVIGKPLPARNAIKIVTGGSTFVDDSVPYNLLHARILTSPHAHAVIRTISTVEAQSLPGVHVVVTYKDVPRIAYSSVERIQNDTQLQDQYCLDYTVRYVGDRVAAVVADTPEIAEQALRLIEVEYDLRPAVLDLRQSSESASIIHSEDESRGIFDATRNIAARVHFDVGDIEQGFSEADHIIEGEYIVPATQPAPLEPPVVITYFDANDILVVRTNSQAATHIRRTLSHVLNIPSRRIRIVSPDIGGNFGARQDLVLEDLCAFLTMITRRPVRLAYSLGDQMRSGRVCAPHILRMKTGVKKDGTIVANQMVVLADTGAAGTHMLAGQNIENSALALYPSPNMRFVAEVVYTNHAPALSMRGYELAPEFFALESHMDDIARQIGMDVLALRRKNVLKDGDYYPVPLAGIKQGDASSMITSSGLATCLNIVEEKLGWSAKRGQTSRERFRRGVGMALTLHGHTGSINGIDGAVIKLNEDGAFDVFTSYNENGSGLTTYIAQIAAEALGASIDDVYIHAGDTDISPFAAHENNFSNLYGSGGAVKKAAEQVKRQILAVAGRMLNTLPEMLKLYDGLIRANSGQQLTIAQVASYSLDVENRQIMTTASWKGQAVPMAFAAQGVEVEVDMETGNVRVVKVVSAVDVGQPLNPLLLQVQIEGSIAQALSAGVSEELVSDATGAVLASGLRDYHLLAATEMPEIETHLVETRPISDLFGVRVVGSVPFYGVSAAISNAVLDAADIRIRQIPITPERSLRAIHAMMTKRV